MVKRLKLSGVHCWSSDDKPKIQAREIFMYIMRNTELGIQPKSESGIKYFFECHSRARVDNINILAQILHNRNLTRDDFRYGLIKVMEEISRYGSKEQVELFLNHEFLTQSQFKYVVSSIIYRSKYLLELCLHHKYIKSIPDLYTGQWESVRFHYKFRVDKSKHKDSFLHEVVKYGGSELVVLCINNLKFDVNYQNSRGDTPFHTFIRSSDALEFMRTKIDVLNAFLNRTDFNVSRIKRQIW